MFSKETRMSDIISAKHCVVRKSDVLVKARYKLNSLALKLITLLIANVKKSDEESKEYVFKVKDFMELAGKNYKELYNELDEATEELLRSPLKIPKEKGFLKLNWISSAEYHAGKGYISFKIDSKLRPFIFDLQERFLKYDIKNILPLRSSYSIRVYEILKDLFNKIGRYNGLKKIEKIVELKWLREVLEVPKSYKYNMLKRRVIEKAQTDLMQHTDLKFDYEEIKTGRKVTHLKFIIQENEKNATVLTNNDYAFMKSKRAFINYLRKHYVNRAIMAAPNANFENQISKWSISPDGLIYDMHTVEENVNATRSNEIYTKLYEHAKKSESFKEMLTRKEEFK